MRVGDELRIGVTDMSPDGQGVVYTDDRVLHIAGAMPGDQVRVRVTSLARQSDAAFARLESITEASLSRRRAPCDADASNRGACTGCPLGVLEESAQRQAKTAMIVRALGRDVDAFVAGEALGYRASSKRVVFGEKGAIKLGSFAKGSHRPADMAGCLVDHPLIARAADDVARIASELGIEPFVEATDSGTLRYVWLKTNGTDVLVTLVGRVHDAPEITSLADRLDVAGIALAENAASGNVVRGERVTHLRGLASITAIFDGVTADVGPLGFLQPNPDVAARAYASLVRDAVGDEVSGTRALDLYAGLGITTTLLRRHFDEVVPCESYAESARALGVAPTTVEDFLDSAQADRAELRDATLVVANPPRGGMGARAVHALVALGAPALSIMSCSPSSLARDLEGLLTPNGPYTLARLEAFDTLPQTAHVELVAKLVKGPA